MTFKGKAVRRPETALLYAAILYHTVHGWYVQCSIATLDYIGKQYIRQYMLYAVLQKYGSIARKACLSEVGSFLCILNCMDMTRESFTQRYQGRYNNVCLFRGISFDKNIIQKICQGFICHNTGNYFLLDIGLCLTMTSQL